MTTKQKQIPELIPFIPLFLPSLFHTSTNSPHGFTQCIHTPATAYRLGGERQFLEEAAVRKGV